jgi:hypothetical protein
MGGCAKQNHTPPAPDDADPVDRRPAAGHDRRAVRTVDLTGEDIAAIEASEMAPRFEQLDAELEPKSTSLTEEGARFVRELGQRGNRTKARPADKAFRDSLYDHS